MTQAEVPLEDRFQFGENWQRFLRVLDDERIRSARESFADVLGLADLRGKTLLDIGSGSGLSSLVARMLGARVRSFDFDPNSVACTNEVRRRYFPDDPAWVVSRGSALDGAFMSGLGTFDVVYAWGVLHHTGDMWRAIELAAERVAPGGRLFLAIYNDCGRESRRWWHLKRLYNKLPGPLRAPYAVAAVFPYEVRHALGSLVRGRPSEYVHSWTRYSSLRGMSRWRDIVDWVGGFPYEYASLQALKTFMEERGLTQTVARETKGLGCHEVVYQRG